MHKKTILCLNGEFVPTAQATLPVTDRGTRLGDGVFETIRLMQGVPYQWELHIARLAAGLAALRIVPPAADWQAVARKLIVRNRATEGFLRISVSRGSGSRGYLPEADITASWFMEYQPATPLPAAPYTLWRSSMERPSPTALPANHKLAHGIGSTLALLEARDHGCDEALLLSSAQHLCEAASANLFWVTEGQLFTPALATNCLAGTTRAAVMRLSPVPCHEVNLTIEALQSAETVFLTNARLGVWPITTLAPLGWRYDTDHPTLTDIATRLTADYAAYIAIHRANWGSL